MCANSAPSSKLKKILRTSRSRTTTHYRFLLELVAHVTCKLPRMKKMTQVSKTAVRAVARTISLVLVRCTVVLKLCGLLIAITLSVVTATRVHELEYKKM